MCECLYSNTTSAIRVSSVYKSIAIIIVLVSADFGSPWEDCVIGVITVARCEKRILIIVDT